MKQAEPTSHPPTRLERFAEWAWPEHPQHLRDVPSRLRPPLTNIARLTVAGVVAYLLTLITTSGKIDLTGTLTALLVVQASAFSTVKSGAVRVSAVAAGVAVATVLSNWIGLTWWSLGASIALSLLIAKVLRLGEQALEAPISAMLILGVANHEVAAEIRILNTLIGAGVGVALNLIYPPAMPTASAGRALLKVAEAAASPLDAAAEALSAGPISRSQVESWIGRARAGSRDVARATETITLLRDSRVLNPRAFGTVDVEPILASGLETLEHCLLAIRALFVVLLAEIPQEDEPDDPYGDDLRQMFAVVMYDVAQCLRAFGTLVVAEAEGHADETEDVLATSLEMLRDTQAMLTDLILVDAHDRSSWLLRGSILAAIQQVLSRLDLEDRARIRRMWLEEQKSRPFAQLPMLIRGMLPHPDKPYPRAFELDAWRRQRAEQATSLDSADLEEPSRADAAPADEANSARRRGADSRDHRP